MPEIDLQGEQEPLQHEYEENPDAAQITLTATGEEHDDVRACSVDIGRAVYEAELHEGVGRPGAAACSGDLLLGALAACSQLTAQAVAENVGADVEISVEANGDLDLRGTLGATRTPLSGSKTSDSTSPSTATSTRTRGPRSGGPPSDTAWCTRHSRIHQTFKRRGRSSRRANGRSLPEGLLHTWRLPAAIVLAQLPPQRATPFGPD
jgi:organic hydroperoxide reductase OsmC/OhrA